MHPRTPHPTPLPSPAREYDLDHGIIYTEVKPSAARVMTLAFVLLIFSVPVGQLILELSQHHFPVVLQVFQTVPTRASLRQYEENLETAAIPRRYFQPLLQLGVSGGLGFGSDKVVLGRDGWLFYTPGVDYLTGPGFLSPEQIHVRHKKMVDEGKTEFRPDPRPAILQFHEQCRQRGVRLVLLPIPDKAQIQPAQVSRHASFERPIPPPTNPDYRRFIAELREKGVEVIDVLPSQLAPDDRRFLKQDTHWTPQWMAEVAHQVAEHLRPQLPATTAPALTKQSAQVTRLGDLVDMLRLPADQKLFQPQTVTVERIVDAQNKRPWQPNAAADVLVLGDSFSNIFSAEAMGWSNSAGFIEHLAYDLGRPLDRLVRNDAGAHATREMLAKELQRGNDRLAGKKIVIWEFAARELACGDWKLLPMTLGEKREVGMYTPPAGKTVAIRGVVRAAAPAPRPGTVPYKDHILMLHLADLGSADDPSANGKEAVVFAWSMRDNKAMPAAHYRPGDVVQLRAQPWTDVGSKYETINRSELDDEKLLFANAAWAGEGESSSAVGSVQPTVPGESKTPPGASTNAVPTSAPVTGAQDGGAAFREFCGKKAAEGDSMAVPGNDGWLFLRSELRHLGAGPFWGEAAAKVSQATRDPDPLPAIVDLNQKCSQLGIKLVLVPVPPRAVVYADKLLEKVRGVPARLDRHHQEFYRLLRKEGVTVVDLTDDFLAARAEDAAKGPVFCEQDTHWSPRGIEIAADRIAAAVGKIEGGRPLKTYRLPPKKLVITGDLVKRGPDAAAGKTEMTIAQVSQSADSFTAVTPDDDSPIILLTDSHGLVFSEGGDMHTEGAGVADLLAAKLGMALDLMARRGSGAEIRFELARRFLTDPAVAAKKKVVIYLFAARAFTESNSWRPVPLTKPQP